METFGYGDLIRSSRKARDWTQRDLADRVGCSDGYVAHLEREVKIPSDALCDVLAQEFELSIADQEQLHEYVQNAREHHTQERIRLRGQARRNALRFRGAARASISEDEIDLKDAASELARNPQLREAFRHLRAALENPDTRDAVATTLRMFAERAGNDDASSE